MLKIVNCSNFETDYPVYILDSNIYIELAKFYYSGKFANSYDTTEMKEWFINARRKGKFSYNFATLETSFDYGTNCLNNKAMNQTLLAVDALITQLSDEEISNCSVRNKVYNDVDRKLECFQKSIFDCELPNLIFDRDDYFISIYYISYLYRLKIQMLYAKRKASGIEKTKELFDYMLNKIGLLSGIEFQLGKMLFVGDNKAVTLSKKILKPDLKPNLKSINNSIIDIIIFRITQKMASLPEMQHTQILFVTCDEALAKLFSATYPLVMGQNMAELHTDETDVAKQYQQSWQDFYDQTFIPELKKRAMASENIYQERDSIMENIKKEIIVNEQAIY